MKASFWSSPFGTRISQRIFRLFLACAVLPVMLVAFIANSHVEHYLESRISRGLRRSNRLLANNLADILLLFESAFRQQMAEMTGCESDDAAFPGHCLVGPDSLFEGVGIESEERVRFAGALVDFAVLTDEDRRFIDKGGVLVKYLPDDERSSRQLVMFGATKGRHAYCVVRLDYLRKRVAQEGAALGSDLVVLTSSREVVLSTVAEDLLPDLSNLDRTDGAVFDVAYDRGGIPFLGVVSSLFLKGRFGSENWLVVLVGPKAAILEPVHKFRRTFMALLAVTIAAVCLLAITQIRRYTAHVETLCRAAGHLERRDFSHRLDIASGDEFEDLCRAFNTMADSIQVYERELEEHASSLQESEQRYRRLVELGPDAVVVVRDGQCRFVNRAFSDMLGYTSDDIAAGVWFGALLRDCQPADVLVCNGCDDVATSRAPRRCTVDLLTKDGRCVPCETFAVAIPHSGQPADLISIRDISERKEMEEQLLHSEKMKAIGQLAGGVAHDFNNQLGVIMGCIELCRSAIKDGRPAEEWLDQAMGGAKHSADLTRQLLAFARKETIVPEVLNLNDAVEGILKMLQRLIGGEVDLAWKPGKDLWAVKLDPSQVDQLVTNLCVNARDAIEGAGSISIETANATLDADYCEHHADVVPGDYVCVTVSDTGCGMEPDMLKRVFEPFFTTKPVGEGTGLGLATVHGIVKQNAGHIEILSELKRGTTFSVYLPRFASSQLGDAPQAEARPVPSGGNETVLLVEDEVTLRFATRLMLEEVGYTVLAAGTPEDALQVAGEHHDSIDLLLTDVAMSGMNGRELAEKLIARHGKLRCLYMSGYSEATMTDRGVLEEGADFLAKPFTRDALLRKIRNVLDAEETASNGDQ